jgi:hypothetical protein
VGWLTPARRASSLTGSSRSSTSRSRPGGQDGRARDIILRADRRVTESIKWKTPTFAYQGNIASFNPSKHLLSIMFHRGAEIPGVHPRLEGGGKLVRTMRFADLDQLEAGRNELEAVIRSWCDWKAGPGDSAARSIGRQA